MIEFGIVRQTEAQNTPAHDQRPPRNISPRRINAELAWDNFTQWLPNISGRTLRRATATLALALTLSGCGNGESSASRPVPYETSVIPVPDPDRPNYYAQDGRIYKDGERLILHGVNMYGFNLQEHVIPRLWSYNYKELVNQVRGLGANTVRLPICPTSFYGAPVQGVNYELNPELRNKNSKEILELLMQDFQAVGIHAVIDYHSHNCDTIPELPYTDLSKKEEQIARWQQTLIDIATHFKDYPNFVGIGLINEPHGRATWNTGNPDTDLMPIFEETSLKILEQNPNILIFIPAISNGIECGVTIPSNWGGDAACVYLNKVPKEKGVIEVHVYGPAEVGDSYEHFSDPNFPDNMPAIWDQLFGHLRYKGYTVFIGEWGTFYRPDIEDDPLHRKDVRWARVLTAYLRGKGICDNAYWAAFAPTGPQEYGLIPENPQEGQPQRRVLVTQFWGRCE